VLDKMVRAQVLTEAAAVEAEAEPLPRRAPFPALAWHAAGELALAAPVTQASVVSTIDADLQARLEPMAAAVAATQGTDATAAILVVEIKGRAVRAGRLGRPRPARRLDRHDPRLRSPGSALKPFIYAFAMDDGLVAPTPRSTTAATRFADYQPENFDRVFHDKVTAREALAYSLNVPAVATLESLGPEAFAGRLEAAGAAGAAEDGAQGGGPGPGLGRRGDHPARPGHALRGPRRRRHRQAAGLDRGRRQARERVRRNPHGPPRGGAPGAGHPARGAGPARPRAVGPDPGGPAMAFKTGTSYGFRDAVAAGWSAAMRSSSGPVGPTAARAAADRARRGPAAAVRRRRRDRRPGRAPSDRAQGRAPGALQTAAPRPKAHA
jgi:penicillin-binding protein 1C